MAYCDCLTSQLSGSKRLYVGCTNNVSSLWDFQGHALEQGHDPEGVGGLHQETTAGTAESQGAGDSPEEARARQSTPDAEDTGKPTVQTIV